jgi:protein-S-isoprenylcysteine O-methyltransferase Ste14
MSSGASAGPTRFPWPPVLYIGSLIIAIALSILVPLPWFGSPFADLLLAFGCLLVLAFLALTVTAIRTLARARTTIVPTQAAQHLVTNGPFAVSRNPLYLGNALLMFGIGLIGGWVWFFVLGLAAAFLTQQLAIIPEERHLASRFGKKYHDYKKKVRRWI